MHLRQPTELVACSPFCLMDKIEPALSSERNAGEQVALRQGNLELTKENCLQEFRDAAQIGMQHT